MSSLHADDDTYLADTQATEAFGAALVPGLTPGLSIWLSGDLGAGKTTLTRGLLRALGYAGSVKSPTYTLMESYVISRIALYHFDFYRFASPEEFLEAGLDEFFGAAGVCLVEWADKARPYVPEPDLEISLRVEGEGRVARLESRSQRGIECLKLIQANP
jgi:tRNA threonylcarbamoyladenosine biosynthesis protein TsaE